MRVLRAASYRSGYSGGRTGRVTYHAYPVDTPPPNELGFLTNLSPFFTFYGGKWRAAPLYAKPESEKNRRAIAAQLVYRSNEVVMPFIRGGGVYHSSRPKGPHPSHGGALRGGIREARRAAHQAQRRATERQKTL